MMNILKIHSISSKGGCLNIYIYLLLFVLLTFEWAYPLMMTRTVYIISGVYTALQVGGKKARMFIK